MIDWTATWGVIGPAVVGLATWLGMRKPRQAAVDSAVAADRAEVAISGATEAQYKGLREDLDMLRRDITSLRSELDKERAHSRRLERQLWLLEGIMRKAGMEPPPFEYGDAN